jgi:hypothetical protein
MAMVLVESMASSMQWNRYAAAKKAIDVNCAALAGNRVVPVRLELIVGALFAPSQRTQVGYSFLRLPAGGSERVSVGMRTSPCSAGATVASVPGNSSNPLWACTAKYLLNRKITWIGPNGLRAVHRMAGVKEAIEAAGAISVPIRPTSTLAASSRKHALTSSATGYVRT